MGTPFKDIPRSLSLILGTTRLNICFLVEYASCSTWVGQMLNDQCFGVNTRTLDLIGTWRTTQENMRNHIVTWL
jgi:hypothetical protein